jgi:HEXXH motif-containing protein
VGALVEPVSVSFVSYVSAGPVSVPVGLGLGLGLVMDSAPPTSPAAADFAPEAGRARGLDARMRQRLAESLRYVGRCIAEHLPLPEGFGPALRRIERAPVGPLVFGAYYELVVAVEDGALDRASGLLAEIAAVPDAPAALRIMDLADPALDAASARYRRLVDTDPELSFEMRPPPRERSDECRRHLAAALVLMQEGAPDLAAEIEALLREVVLAVGPETPDAVVFDGASSFMLWGAVVLNATNPRNRLDAVQALAHETGHNLLFGFGADGALVENGEEDRYASPLRHDPRPIDGIFHATFVSARMHWALCRLVAAGVLDAAEEDEARREIEANVKRFAQGIETLDRHARLTPAGAAAMAPARAWMQTAG